ncbi:MAG: SDR family oxidoreductase [Bradyrhizobiaceae bacterium]|nr:SDR family oxidoreductase [Bradyrhizobiaceae bacterium]
MRLAGKAAIVTGAAGNIGLATARLFVKEGAKVLLVDRDEASLAAAMQELGSGQAEALAADVTKPADIERYAARAVERFGGIDIFFNNAGIEGPIAPIEDYPDDGFERVMAVNATGVFLGVKHVLPKMREWGSMIITSSIMGLRGGVRGIGYSASKHAVIGIMRAAAKHAGPRHIRVNTIHPGFVESAMFRRIVEENVKLGIDVPDEFYLKQVPFGTFVTPHEIAQTVLFLASDESRQVTGQTIAIDGGYLL